MAPHVVWVYVCAVPVFGPERECVSEDETLLKDSLAMLIGLGGDET